MKVSISNEEMEECARKMTAYVKPFITPVTRQVNIEAPEGEACGSASYFEKEGRQFIVTNEHVSRELGGPDPVSHGYQFYGSSDIYATKTPFASLENPIDVSIADFTDFWHRKASSTMAKCIPFEKMQVGYSYDPDELYFVAGFPGEGVDMHFGQLCSKELNFLTQEVSVPIGLKNVNPEYRFALRNDSKDAICTSDAPWSALPPPPGVSGSLVWRTNYVNCRKNSIEWNPEKHAVVAGIACLWDDRRTNVIIATKIDKMQINQLTNSLMDMKGRTK